MIVFKTLTSRISAITEENAMYTKGQKVILKWFFNFINKAMYDFHSFKLGAYNGKNHDKTAT